MQIKQRELEDQLADYEEEHINLQNQIYQHKLQQPATSKTHDDIKQETANDDNVDEKTKRINELM